MHALRAELAITEEKWRERTAVRFNKDTSADLSMDEARVVIDGLESLKAKRIKDGHAKGHGDDLDLSKRKAAAAANVPPEMADALRAAAAHEEREPGSDDE